MNPPHGNSTPSSHGEWRKPEPGEHRGPCPALNALANGGHIPRNGKATADQLIKAMVTYLGIAPRLAAGLANAAVDKLGKPGPDGVKVLELSALSLHGFIEHDASLTRRDTHRGDAAEFLEPLLQQLIALSTDGKTLTRTDLAVAHQLRVAQSAAEGHKVSLKAGLLGTLEASFLFSVLSRDGVIAIADLVEFLQHERIPANLKPRKVGRFALFSNAATLAVLGNEERQRQR